MSGRGAKHRTVSAKRKAPQKALFRYRAQMTKTTDDELRARLRDPGFTPAARDTRRLISWLGENEALDRDLERALLQLGVKAAHEALDALDALTIDQLLARIRFVSKVAREHHETLWPALIALMSHREERVRRSVANAAGRSGVGALATTLIDAWPVASSDLEKKAIAEALGKLGDSRAIALLKDFRSSSQEVKRVRETALTRLERDALRENPAQIRADFVFRPKQQISIRSRDGLEGWLANEARHMDAHVHARGEVIATATSLAEARALRLGTEITLARGEKLHHGKPDDAIVALITDSEKLSLLRALTEGAFRYRIDWQSGGHQRSRTEKIAATVRRRNDKLINDPREPVWVAHILENENTVTVAWEPKALPDTRFDYLGERVNAASHPTIAAAIARVGEARFDDHVWDPFVGGGTELIERAKLGAFQDLLGSDIDPAAIEVARETLERAGITATFATADALGYKPKKKPNLILTNPPLGRRIHRTEHIVDLLEDFVVRAASHLAKGGRMVWMSPRGEETADLAKANGLIVHTRQRVDIGGITAELQRFDKPE